MRVGRAGCRKLKNVEIRSLGGEQGHAGGTLSPCWSSSGCCICPHLYSNHVIVYSVVNKGLKITNQNLCTAFSLRSICLDLWCKESWGRELKGRWALNYKADERMLFSGLGSIINATFRSGKKWSRTWSALPSSIIQHWYGCSAGWMEMIDHFVPLSTPHSGHIDPNQ